MPQIHSHVTRAGWRLLILQLVIINGDISSLCGSGIDAAAHGAEVK